MWRPLYSRRVSDLKVPITESDARQHGVYLSYIITKSFFYFKIFQHNAKAGLLSRLCTKKATNVIFDLFKMKQFHWLLCVAKNCDWSRKIAPLSNLTRASLLTAKAEVSCKIYKSWRKCWKNQVSFFFTGAALWAEKLGRCLENYSSWKSTLGKFVVTVNLEAISFKFWMKGA